MDSSFNGRSELFLFQVTGFSNQTVVFAGATVKQIWLMDLGRFLFGIGGESITVAQNTYAVLWFKGKELNFVFGLQLSIGTIVRFWHLRASDIVIAIFLP